MKTDARRVTGELFPETRRRGRPRTNPLTRSEQLRLNSRRYRAKKAATKTNQQY